MVFINYFISQWKNYTCYTNYVNLVVNLILIYCFVYIGFFAKRKFKHQLNENSFVLIYIYFLMPIVMIWGILSKPLDIDLFLVPLYFFIVLITSFFITYLLSKLFLKDPKNQAIAIITGIIGNTGNMGIPIGLAIYGVESVPYTAMINLVNALFLMTVGAYTYSRGSFSVKTSLANIIKLPMIWATLIALTIQFLTIVIPEELFKFLEMGAYAGLVVQLFTFGMFLATVKWTVFYPRIVGIVLGSKFILFPLLTILLINFLEISSFLANILLLQALVPIAVNNVNLASLYDCYPEKVAWVSFIAFIIALFLLPIGLIGLT